MKRGETYNIELGKGTGIIQETILLLEIYSAGMKQDEMLKIALDTNLLVKSSVRRTSDIVKVGFYKRFVNQNPQVAEWLKQLVSKSIGITALSQILLIYTARTHKIFADFVTQVYWPSVRNGENNIDINFAKRFIQNAITNTDLVKGWSESTQNRVAGYLISTLVDFRYLDQKRNAIPFYLHDTTANYLAHELHFNKVTDNGMLESADWALFGYSKYDTISHIERLSFKGSFIFQNSGEIIKMNWNHKSMEGLINELG
jgi:hypothetical protein